MKLLGVVRRTSLELTYAPVYPAGLTKPSRFRYFKASPDVIGLAVMLYIRFLFSLRNFKDLLHERGIGISHETVRCCWERTPFHITRNELAVAHERRSEWRRFRLWNFSREPKAFELHPPLGAHVSLTAMSFQARFH